MEAAKRLARKRPESKLHGEAQGGRDTDLEVGGTSRKVKHTP